MAFTSSGDAAVPITSADAVLLVALRLIVAAVTNALPLPAAPVMVELRVVEVLSRPAVSVAVPVVVMASLANTMF